MLYAIRCASSRPTPFEPSRYVQLFARTACSKSRLRGRTRSSKGNVAHATWAALASDSSPSDVRLRIHFRRDRLDVATSKAHPVLFVREMRHRTRGVECVLPQWSVPLSATAQEDDTFHIKPLVATSRNFRSKLADSPSAKATAKTSFWPNGAAQESNLPSRGLHDLTGFEDRLGHRAHAAPTRRLPGRGARWAGSTDTPFVRLASRFGHSCTFGSVRHSSKQSGQSEVISPMSGY